MRSGSCSIGEDEGSPTLEIGSPMPGRPGALVKPAREPAQSTFSSLLHLPHPFPAARSSIYPGYRDFRISVPPPPIRRQAAIPNQCTFHPARSAGETIWHRNPQLGYPVAALVPPSRSGDRCAHARHPAGTGAMDRDRQMTEEGTHGRSGEKGQREKGTTEKSQAHSKGKTTSEKRKEEVIAPCGSVTRSTTTLDGCPGLS